MWWVADGHEIPGWAPSQALGLGFGFVVDL